MLQITKYDVLGKLPDPFIFKNGEKVKNIDDWEKRREEIFADAVELQYGELLPEPEFLEVEGLFPKCIDTAHPASYRIYTGRRNNPIVLTFYIHIPLNYKAGNKYPVVLDGDMAFSSMHDSSLIEPFIQNGIMFVKFNRCEVARDCIWQQSWEDGRKGDVYRSYPETLCSNTMAWAWSYSRVLDALIKLGLVDERYIAFTGLSRGGKTALLAGVLDKRATFVNPISTCAGGAACYRTHLYAIDKDDGKEKPSETLKDIWGNFPSWFGKDFGAYAERENELPFDSHFLKALVAPRVLFVSEADNDIWANPVGSYHTSLAAKEVWKLYGKPENIQWYMKKGNHYHGLEDMQMLANLMLNKIDGRPLNENFGRLYFEDPAKVFDWVCPGEEND